MPATMDNCLEEAIQVFADGDCTKGIPAPLLRKCKGVIVAHVNEYALAATGGAGKGVMVAHKEDGSWGPPAAVSVSSMGIGADIGVASKYIFIIPMTEDGFKTLTQNEKLQLGLELGIAIGELYCSVCIVCESCLALSLSH